jgi:hypothetical protein
MQILICMLIRLHLLDSLVMERQLLHEALKKWFEKFQEKFVFKKTSYAVEKLPNYIYF